MTINLMPTPEFVRLNRSRVHEGMDPLPDDETLDATLQAAGITHCEGKPYPWAK